MTGWKKHECLENNAQIQVVTNGEQFIHCDRTSIEVLDHGKFAVLERYNTNYDMDEELTEIFGAFSEHSDNTVVNCNNCDNYMMSDEMHVVNDEAICRVCAGR
jgi:hypothetical protein